MPHDHCTVDSRSRLQPQRGPEHGGLRVENAGKPWSLNLPAPLCYALVRLVRRWVPLHRGPASRDQAAYFIKQYQSTANAHARYWRDLHFNKRVILDLGSGLGGRAPYWLEQGAARVICIDINRQELEAGQAILRRHFPTLIDRVTFLHPDEVVEVGFADVAILFDSFEHLVDPLVVLDQCHQWLRPGGRAWIGSIGRYHQAATHCGGHVPIPWSQLLFSERAIIRTIRRVVRDPQYVPNVWEQREGIDRWDHVETLKDRPGEPLNLLSLREVRRLLAATPFTVDRFQTHGFSGTRRSGARFFSALAQVPVLNEIFHSYYTCTLIKTSEGPSTS